MEYREIFKNTFFTEYLRWLLVHINRDGDNAREKWGKKGLVQLPDQNFLKLRETIFAKHYMLDVWQGFEYVSGLE